MNRGTPKHDRDRAALRSERGFSLVEAIAATVIATIAVLGLAHSFGVGRGLINQYAVTRDALGVAQKRMEMLVMSDPLGPDLTIGAHPAVPIPVLLGDGMPGTVHWTVGWVNDPANNGNPPPNTQDYKRVTVKVGWSVAGVSDTVRLWRFFLPR